MKLTAVAAFGAALITLPVAAHAQEVAAEPAVAESVAADPAETDAVAAEPAASAAQAPAEAQLAANTPVLLSLNSEANSRHMRVGDTFALTVAQDVAVDGHVVIPRGTRAVGEITWRTGKGAFGKSGKMEMAIRYLDLDGRRIPIDGYHRQEGEGNTAGTAAAVLAAGVIGGLVVTGRSAVVPAGREFTARTIDAIPVAVSADGRATILASYAPSAVLTGRQVNEAEAARRAERRQRRQSRRRS